MVHGGTHNHHGFAFGFVGVIGKLSRYLNYFLPGDAGNFFLPGGGVGDGLVIEVGGDIVSAQASVDTIVGHHQIVDCGHLSLRAIGQCNPLYGHLAQLNIFAVLMVPVIMLLPSKIGKGHGGCVVAD